MQRLYLTALLAAFCPLRAAGIEPAPDAEHVVVYHDRARFAAWPANNGVWIWGDEILVGFNLGHYQEKTGEHSVDTSRPQHNVFARSLDGGKTWRFEEPVPFAGRGLKPSPSPGGIDFLRPGFAMRLGWSGPSPKTPLFNDFLYSYDRGKTWKGPFELPDIDGALTTRTDYIPVSRNECLLFMSSKKAHISAALPDRAFSAITRDGGKTFQFLAWITPGDDKARSVMSSSVRAGKAQIVTALRRRIDDGGKHRNWIDIYVSDDDARSWRFLSKAADTGDWNGNPPSLLQMRDGRLCLTYGYRAQPFGIRARLSPDKGKTWGEEILVRGGARTEDFGYTRTVQRRDGKLVTIYYFTATEKPEQHIAATIWETK